MLPKTQRQEVPTLTASPFFRAPANQALPCVPPLGWVPSLSCGLSPPASHAVLPLAAPRAPWSPPASEPHPRLLFQLVLNYLLLACRSLPVWLTRQVRRSNCPSVARRPLWPGTASFLSHWVVSPSEKNVSFQSDRSSLTYFEC